jgi:hypothetical protein
MYFQTPLKDVIEKMKIWFSKICASFQIKQMNNLMVEKKIMNPKSITCLNFQINTFCNWIYENLKINLQKEHFAYHAWKPNEMKLSTNKSRSPSQGEPALWFIFYSRRIDKVENPWISSAHEDQHFLWTAWFFRLGRTSVLCLTSGH